MMKKLIVLCLMLLLALGCAAAETDDRIFVAENERLALYLKADHCGIDVEDKLTGTVWSSSMNDPNFTGKIAGLNQKKANSLLTVNITNLVKGAGSITNAVLLNDKQLATGYELIEGGVRVDYDLGANMIRVSVEILLQGDTVLVRVPYERIEGYGDFSIVSIDMMPFLCSASDNTDGFLFYPDGSGAILEFKDYAHFKETTQLFSVYGNLEKHNSVLDFFEQEDPTVLMPVYGISTGGNAMLAVIEEGAEAARISVNSSTKILALNYVFANFQYRRGFDDMRVTSRQIKTYDKKAMETDYSLRLIFLPEGKDTYSDMAVAYRDYLLNDQGWEPRLNDQAVAIDLFMSAPEKGLLFDTQRTVTTLDEAEKIIDALAQKGVEKIQMSLKGWAKGGYGNTPDNLPVERSVGSAGSLTALMDKTEQMGSTLSLTANFVEATKDSWGYSKRNDVVYLSNYAILTNEEEDTFILSPEAMYRKFSEFRREAQKLGVNGLRFEFIGDCLTFNYNNGHYHTSADSLATCLKMLQESREAFGHVSVVGGAVALAQYADLMTEVPYDDSGFQFTTTSVPFYQIVMHGVRDYTGVPGNLSSDLERETLRWVEMGYMPYFELTWDSTEELMYTEYQNLFTAQYTAWIDEVAEIAKAFTVGDLKDVRTAMIMQHECIATDLYKVTYDNGCIVYVNYGSADAQADGLTIPARDYLVTKEGAK